MIPNPFLPPKGRRQSVRESLENIELSVEYAPGRDQNAASRVFIAQYSGKCPCGEMIRPGDRAHFTGQDVLAHEGCDGTETPSLGTTEKIMGMGPKEVAKARSNLCPECYCIRLRSGLCGTCDA